MLVVWLYTLNFPTIILLHAIAVWQTAAEGLPDKMLDFMAMHII